MSRNSSNIQFSTREFYERYLRQYWGLKGAIAHLPAQVLQDECILLMQQAKLSPQECGIMQDQVWISKRALIALHQYLNSHQREMAATRIQRAYKTFKRKHDDKRREYLVNYIESISSSYFQVLNSNRASASKHQGPSNLEVDFMKILNHSETSRVCAEYLDMVMEYEKNPLRLGQRMTFVPGIEDPQNTLIMYLEYAPKVILWIGAVLGMNLDPGQDFVSMMRSGDLLCRLAVSLYKKVTCHLLDKGIEYGIHKIIFFLELCKSLHIKRSLLFKVGDLLVWPEDDTHKKSGLIVLRTVLTLEKHARKSGWQGPMLNLKTNVNINLGVSTRESMIEDVKKTEHSPRHRYLEDKEGKHAMFESRSSSKKSIEKEQPKPNTGEAIIGDVVYQQKNNSIQNLASNNSHQSNLKTDAVFKSTQATANFDDTQNIPGSVVSSMKLKNNSSTKLVEQNPVDDKPRRGSESAVLEKNAKLQNRKSSLPIKQSFDSSSSVDNLLSDGISDTSEFKPNRPVTGEDVEKDDNWEYVPPNAENSLVNGLLIKRSDMINNLIRDEETYAYNLSNVMEYLETLIKKRRRRSQRLSQLENEGSLDNPSFEKTSSNQRQEGETDVAYKFRLETEIEELGLLFTVIQRMVSIHVQLLTQIKEIAKRDPSMQFIGDAFTKFSDTLQRAYSTYAVVALSGNNKTSLELPNRGELEHSEFVSRVVGKFIGSKDKDNDTSSAQWLWYLQRPVVRLAYYTKLLQDIHIPKNINLDMDQDNRKLAIAMIKLECISRAITESLGMKNFQ